VVERPGGKPPSPAAFLFDAANELLVRNRGHLPEIQFSFTTIDLGFTR
jgi:hypothetical protein